MWFLRNRILTFSNWKLILSIETLLVRSLFCKYIAFSNRKHTTMFIIFQPCQHVTNVVLVYWNKKISLTWFLLPFLLDTSNLLFVFCVKSTWMHHSYNFQYSLIIAHVLGINKYPFAINKIESKYSNKNKTKTLFIEKSVLWPVSLFASVSCPEL